MDVLAVPYQSQGTKRGPGGNRSRPLFCVSAVEEPASRGCGMTDVGFRSNSLGPNDKGFRLFPPDPA